MKFKRLYLLIGVLLLIPFVGCKNQQKNVGTSFETQTEIQENSQSNENENLAQKEFYVEDLIETETINLPMVINNNYSKAYAEALFEGAKIPSEEAYILMKENESIIQNEPRLVIDCNEKMHIIWTNDEMFLVIDGKETKLKVSDCIFTDKLPELPENLEKLDNYHQSNEQIEFGIAENAFLQELCMNLEKKGINSSNGLFRVRFYNDNGKAVAVYSLTENGKLYINTEKANEYFNREKGG